MAQLNHSPDYWFYISLWSSDIFKDQHNIYSSETISLHSQDEQKQDFLQISEHRPL